MAQATTNQVVGILLIVLGALIAFGKLGLGLFVTVGAVAAIVVGVLILVRAVRGSQAMGVALVVVGALVLASPYLFAGVSFVLNMVVGILCIVAGVLKLQGKW